MRRHGIHRGPGSVGPQHGTNGGGGYQEQTHQVFANLKAVLEAAGTSLENVVKATVFIVDMDKFGEVNEVYANYFTGDFPARSCVEVGRLPKGALVEIEVVAAL